MAAISQALGQQMGLGSFSQRPYLSYSSQSNCTRCSIWQGDECFEYKPCVFCNATVECAEPLSCQDNICTLDPLYGGGARKDPLGRIIALSLLAIFLLGIFTLCMRICASTCGADGRKCCIVQCAISVQCCCEWKAGRLRILPPPGNSVEPSSIHHRRDSLCPPPPPAYGEIYPEEENQEANRPIELQAETVQPNQQRSDLETGNVTPSASRSNNFLRWFTPFSVTTNSRTLHETSGCNHHNGITEQAMSVHESGSRMNRNRNWFRRAATLVAGPGPQRQQEQHRRHEVPALTTPTTPWTTTQSSNLHQIVTSSSSYDVTDDIPTTEHVMTTQPQSAWKPEPSTPSPPPPPQQQPPQQQPLTMSSNSRRQGIFSFQHRESFNDDDDDENEETISENLNSAINSLLDFQTADLEAVIPPVGRHRDGASAITAVTSADNERYVTSTASAAARSNLTSTASAAALSNLTSTASAAARSNLSRQVSINEESGSWDNSRATSATVVTEIRTSCERQRSTTSGRWSNSEL